MVKRRGVSLLNVMVFMVFAVMLTAQVFFFAKNAADDVADEREMMMYRMNLDSLVDEAKKKLEGSSIKHDKNIVSANYSNFYKKIKVWPTTTPTDDSTFPLTIYDLHYDYKYSASFTPSAWQSGDKKVFAAMPPLSYDKQTKLSNDVISHDYTVTNRYYLIRAWVQLPENFYGRKLMYQVLVSRDNEDDKKDYESHNVEVLSFQEVWF